MSDLSYTHGSASYGSGNSTSGNGGGGESVVTGNNFAKASSLTGSNTIAVGVWYFIGG